MEAQWIKIYEKNNSQALIDQVVQVLNKNGVIIYPTDTMYALGCSIQSAQAISRICEIKQIKPNKNRFSFICADLSSIANFAKVSDFAFKVLKRYLPGPYTFVLPASSKVPSVLVQGKKTVGIRIPNYLPILEIVKVLGHPLLTTTLPQEGLDVEDFTDPSLIFDTYKNKVDLVLDGDFGGLIASSVIDLSEDEIEVIREGAGDCSDFL
ncbi:threonylcarbamoyl-AMP synthase [Aquirufa nivalisilvae]|uniref:L-threonylcarbamoyladenylate synthase n=1 Tax=Aquirufa nivalisilvae TaxID=2516557 RepID=A0A2S2DV05_9BACT|nr:L-threonylcarbamoyladenylate synthase [Aquirufa nivalisilvae]AWL09186.1 L-threonylcarbamoyladenylate synthase [Aquirufa nivalisilvae]MCZ2480317.1 threonylcarbamoyl-AMP synthase [Aquirufa nivalisilvae]MCZ2482288.1 threonylcarbamoyl-AMP synthase [Aquirufa nivalisilvae]TBH73679.1 threonylcarbamoyl-AMP synthase [Aquirufa nivalisilvae]